MEYRKLLRSGEYSTEDLRLYGILHQEMMRVCGQKAEELFDRVIRKGPDEDPDVYWATRRQKVYLLWETGRNRENIDEYQPLVDKGSNEVQVWICLIQAYALEENHKAALELLRKAENQFPENAFLHIYAGDLMRSMQRYEEAFLHWERALEMEPQWCDAAYSMASCYEELGDYGKAYEVYSRIADDLERRGFEAEVNWPRSLADRCRRKV
jgi:tetratricopeptide (TPR) repeat protein